MTRIFSTGIAIAACLFASVGLADGPELVFKDATEASGLAKPLKGMMSHAAACGDVDGDGDLDLYVGAFCDRSPEKYKGTAGPVPNVLLINTGGRFVDSGQAPVAFKARTSGAVFADLDNDGDLDLYVSNNSKRKGLRVSNKLFENVKGRFRDVSEDNGACVIMGGRSIGVLDIDGDGLLDLLVGGDRWTGSQTRLFRNKGKLAFEDAGAKAGLPEDLPALAVLTGDFNGDGFPDIFISQANRMFLSKGDGTYAESKAASKSLQYEPLGREDTPCGAALGDIDRDGRLDIVIVDHNQPARQHLFINSTKRGGEVMFRDATKDAGLAYLFPSWTPGKLHLKHAHVEIADFDNDGWLDIAPAVTWRSGAGDTEKPFICRNLTKRGGKPRFAVPPIEKATAYFPAGPVADFDRDGRPDIMLASWFPEIPSRLLLNRGKTGRWLRVRVIGKTINRMGIGAKIKIYQAGKLGRPASLLGYQEIHISNGFCTGQEAVAHFGLGDAATCDVEVTLPHNKGVIRKSGAKADQLLTVTEK
ncbi:MAG: CRTAC1 family protein [Phycisphaerae bacterium]|nr:CRTAC1 family protein [Phycisphaerae bacterium]